MLSLLFLPCFLNPRQATVRIHGSEKCSVKIDDAKVDKDFLETKSDSKVFRRFFKNMEEKAIIIWRVCSKQPFSHKYSLAYFRIKFCKNSSFYLSFFEIKGLKEGKDSFSCPKSLHSLTEGSRSSTSFLPGSHSSEIGHPSSDSNHFFKLSKINRTSSALSPFGIHLATTTKSFSWST